MKQLVLHRTWLYFSSQHECVSYATTSKFDFKQNILTSAQCRKSVYLLCKEMLLTKKCSLQHEMQIKFMNKLDVQIPVVWTEGTLHTIPWKIIYCRPASTLPIKEKGLPSEGSTSAGRLPAPPHLELSLGIKIERHLECKCSATRHARLR